MNICLSEDPMVGVDHSSTENTEEDNEGDELVDGPKDITSDVRDSLLNVIIKLTNHSIFSHRTVANELCLYCIILHSTKTSLVTATITSSNVQFFWDTLYKIDI